MSDIIFSLKVALPGDVTKLLSIRRNDNVEEVVSKFSQENQLSENRNKKLYEKIAGCLKISKSKGTPVKAKTHRTPKSPHSPQSIHSKVFSQRSPAKSALSNRQATPIHLISTDSKAQEINYGTYLYDKGLAAQSAKQNKMISQRLKAEAEQVTELTFKPQIRQYQPVESVDPMPRTAKLAYQSEKYRDCTFTPDINPRSDMIAKRNETSRPRYLELYDEFKTRTERKEKIAEAVFRYEHPYHPFLEANKSKDPALVIRRPETKEQFISRIATPTEKVRKSIEAERLMRSQPIDFETGQEFFRPQTGRAPKHKRNSENLSIGSYLYNMRSNSNTRSTQSLSIQNTQTSTSSPFKQKLYAKFLAGHIDTLFKSLDGDNDGIISTRNISTDQLTKKAKDILHPLFERLEVRPMRYDEFKDIMRPFAMSLQQSDRDDLFRITPAAKENQKYQYANPRSIEIIAKRRKQMEQEMLEKVSNAIK